MTVTFLIPDWTRQKHADVWRSATHSSRFGQRVLSCIGRSYEKHGENRSLEALFGTVPLLYAEIVSNNVLTRALPGEYADPRSNITATVLAVTRSHVARQDI